MFPPPRPKPLPLPFYIPLSHFLFSYQNLRAILISNQLLLDIICSQMQMLLKTLRQLSLINPKIFILMKNCESINKFNF